MISVKRATIAVNLNQFVNVKLTEVGKDIYRHRFDEINEKIRAAGIKPIVPSEVYVDKDGYSYFKLIDLFEMYAEHIYRGAETPFEDMEIIINVNEK